MLDLSKFVKNEELIIDEENWQYLKNNYEKDKLKLAISNIIKDLPLPYQEISYQDATDDFKKLCELDSQSLFCDGEWFSRYSYDLPFSNKYIKINKTGSRFSNFFHQKNRWKCDSINAPSPERTWNTEKFRLTLLNGLWTQKIQKINNQTLRGCIALRKYIAAQFRPSAAKAIYEYFGAKTTIDISTGWGDRFAGFLSTDGLYYRGCDPNKNLQEGYFNEMALASKLGRGNKYTRIDCKAFEDISDFSDLEFDLVFTSPPFYCVERYTQDETQSWKRYKKLDDWLNYFLFASLKKSWQTLKTGGHLAINISDVYLHHRVNKICDPMNNYIKNVLGGKFVETIGLQLAKRPQSKSDKQGVFCEPIWVWQKIK